MAFQDSTEEVKEVWTTLEFISSIIGHIIWPITMLIIFWIFRKHFSNIMNKLSGIDATATGISLKFDQEIDEAIGENLTEQTPRLIAKQAMKIGEKRPSFKEVTPYHQMMNIRDGLNHRIILKAQENDISSQNKTNIDLKDELLKAEAISFQQAKLFQTLLQLTNSNFTNITQSQVNKVKLLYSNLKL
ncbi:MAG: hypothetical protein HKP59_09360 [Lutibacter sp.]|uniref:hypothetical protein n=1 Tax=Lutibacter sp. TaxID=1925666 RepID=UPI00180CAB7B|nr:hypothetical protein [Lutibacter sp.]MBT8317825.1 hypothetical protein [Lutibacter sp.]NNJ58683.1 hypothetical protein [Lutibacter sp.]